jgi:hypothetical protein
MRAGDLRGRSKFFFLGVTVAGGDCGSLMGRARLVQRDNANLRSGILHRGGPSRVAGPGKKGYGARTNSFKLQRFGARLSRIRAPLYADELIRPHSEDLQVMRHIFSIFEGASGLGCNLAKC